jgi:hypothetical protein
MKHAGANSYTEAHLTLANTTVELRKYVAESVTVHYRLYSRLFG